MASFVKNLFRGGPKVEAPALPALPAPPGLDAVGMAAIAERRKRRPGVTAPARAGTLLTTGSGLTSPAPTERKTLLGG